MQVQSINNSQNCQSKTNFKAVVKPTWQLKELQMLYSGEKLERLNKYIDIINKSPSDNYYKYVEKNCQPIIYSAKISEKYPIECPYQLYKDPLELFRMIAGIEVGFSKISNPDLYTEAEKAFVEPNIFTYM